MIAPSNTEPHIHGHRSIPETDRTVSGTDLDLVFVSVRVRGPGGRGEQGGGSEAGVPSGLYTGISWEVADDDTARVDLAGSDLGGAITEYVFHRIGCNEFRFEQRSNQGTPVSNPMPGSPIYRGAICTRWERCTDENGVDNACTCRLDYCDEPPEALTCDE